MATVHFYEKPGCINNAKQKQLLQAAGHTVIAHNLLQEAWSYKPEKLRAFFGGLPVAEWFNYNAPAIKHGEIDPNNLCDLQALHLMQQQPLLIRRPLIEVDGHLFAGFNSEHLASVLKVAPKHDAETCPKTLARNRYQP